MSDTTKKFTKCEDCEACRRVPPKSQKLWACHAAPPAISNNPEAWFDDWPQFKLDQHSGCMQGFPKQEDAS